VRVFRNLEQHHELWSDQKLRFLDSPLTNGWEQERLADARKIKDFMRQPQDVAEAVMFMLTRRRGTVVRDLVILPNGFDI